MGNTQTKTLANLKEATDVDLSKQGLEELPAQLKDASHLIKVNLRDNQLPELPSLLSMPAMFEFITIY